MEHFRLESVGPGIWAAIALPGTGSVGNAGLVDLGGATLVFDTFLTPQAAEALRADAERIAPVRWVVNSHAHGDHIRGNMAFPDVPIVSTERTRELIVANALPQVERLKRQPPEEALAQAEDDDERATILQIAESIGRLEQRVPNLTFDGAVTFHGDTRSAQLIDLGRGHSQSDAILWLPDALVCFAGDLIVIETHPSLSYGDPREWLEILDRIEELQPEAIVPGHGRVGAADDIAPLRSYLTSMLDDPDRPPERGWTWPQVHEENVAFLRERAMNEVKEPT